MESRMFSVEVAAALLALTFLGPSAADAQDKQPNIVMLMTDDTGWSDFGAYGGGTTLGHPTPNIDQIAKEGATSPTGMARRAARPGGRRS